MEIGREALHTGVCWGEIGEGQQGVGSLGEIAWGEMPDIDEGGIEAANNLVMYAPMQQPCMTCTCIPEPKVK